MGLPKAVTIYGKTYTVKTDPKRNGACVYWETNVIEIGTAEKQNILTNFLHEVIEQILVENHCRYDNHHLRGDSSRDFVFVMNHLEFENIIPQIRVALKDIIMPCPHKRKRKPKRRRGGKKK